MSKNSIEIVLTVHNESANLEACIKAAKNLTKNITVIDTESTDETVKLAKSLGVRVLSFPYSKYVEPSRSFAMDSAKADWVFILDADERISKKLGDEIKKTIRTTKKTHFLVPRKNIVNGKKWLEYGGWYPDYIIRLIEKESFVRWPKAIHSTPKIDGAKGKLKNPLGHDFQPSLEYMVDKTAVYEDMESDLLFNARRKVTVPILFRKFFGELFRRLIQKSGFRDGTYGIIESFYQAFSKTVTYIFLYEKYKKDTTL